MPKKTEKEPSVKSAKKSVSVKKSESVKKPSRSKKSSSLDNLDQLVDDKNQAWNDKNDDDSLEKSDDSDSMVHSDSDDKADENTDDAHKSEDEHNNDVKSDNREKSSSNTVENKTAGNKATDNTTVPKTYNHTNRENAPKEQSFLKDRVFLDRQEPARNNQHADQHTNQYNTRPNNQSNNQPNSQYNRYNDKPPNRNDNVRVATVQSVAKFVPNDYLKSTTLLKDATVTDLLRTAIAKSQEMGQKHLTDVLTQTLKATNMECEFPSIADVQWRHIPRKKPPYDNRDRNPRY